MADAAAAGAPAASLAATFASLPHALALNVFARLPVDARARCAAVCRGWAATLADASLWTRLDLSGSSGVTVVVTDAVLRGASGLAHSGLVALDVSDCERISRDALLAVLAANAGALRELSARKLHTEAWTERYVAAETTLFLEPLLHAAPTLRSLRAEMLSCLPAEASSLLRNEPPFGPLRVRRMRMEFDADGDDERVPEVLAGVAEHASLIELELLEASLDTPGLMDAVVDVALMRRLERLRLEQCNLDLNCATPLARRLREGALTTLDIIEIRYGADGPFLLEAPSAALLCDALHANTMLTSLRLDGMGMLGEAAVAAALLGALTAHLSLRTLSCGDWNVGGVGGAATIGAAFGALVAANAPALQSLSLPYANLRDADLGPLLDALPGNTHLTELDISGNDVSEECARERLLPAVRANTSLVQLRAQYFDMPGSTYEAEALVASRAPR
jgi:hypothetical protein